VGFGSALGAKKSRENTPVTRTPYTYEALTPWKVTTGTGASEPAKIDCVHDLIENPASRVNRPVLFLLESPEPEGKVLNKSFIDLFNDERVRSALISSCVLVRTAGEEITQTHPYGKWIGGEKLPRLVVFSAGHERVGTLEGRVGSTELFDLLTKAVAKDFDVDLDVRCRAFNQLRLEMTGLEDRIEALDAQIAAKPKSAQKFEKPRAELVRQLEEAERELAKLCEMKPREGSLAWKATAGS